MPKFPAAAVSILILGACLAACAGEVEQPAPTDNADAPTMNGQAAGAETIALNGGDGRPVGSVTLTEGANGVSLKLDASAIAAGTHGLHLHEKGLCEGPKFEAAGAHWNPAGKKHGRDNPEGAHLGDLANLEVPSSGTASMTIEAAGMMMNSGASPLADADGTSLVVHAKPDDYRTDPSGASGDRIACAVLAAPRE